MKRKIAVLGAVAVLAAVLATAAPPAQAADTTHTIDADFSVGGAAYDNIDSTKNDLRVEDIETLSGDWYRGHFNGEDSQIDVKKDAQGSLWAPDNCLPLSTNPFSNSDRFTTQTSGHIYRTGSANSGTHELGLRNGTLVAPVASMQANTIRFITHGAKVADSRYVINVETSSGSSLVFEIPIQSADVEDRAASGVGQNGGSWTSVPTPNFHGGADADCMGDGADEVVLNLPANTQIEKIGIDYPTQTTPAGGGQWLGGPIGFSVETEQKEIDRAFAWYGTYTSSNRVLTAVTSATGGLPIWHEVDWVGTDFFAQSDGDLFLRCGSDSNNDGVISGGEWRNHDGGQTGADVWQEPIALRGNSPFSMNNCTGTHLQYRVVLYPEFATTPRLDEITFSYNPDDDLDGYFRENVPGHGQVDCNDNFATLNHDNGDGDGFSTCQGDCDDTTADVFPNAPVGPGDVGDGVDRDCSGGEECFGDQDGDGQGNDDEIFAPHDFDLICTTSMQESLNADDCDDSRANVFKDNPSLVVGDGLDQDCNGSEECWQNVDGDVYGIDEIIGESTDTGAVCDPANGEAVSQPGGQFDCDDNNPAINPSATDVPGNGVDEDCDGADALHPTTVLCVNRTVTIDMNTNGGDGTGTAGPDVILGTPGDDVIDGLGGNDFICSGSGDDVVNGGDGNDYVRAGSGNDTVHGGNGDDRLFGVTGDDTMNGDAGVDTLHGDKGRDTLDGGADDDRVFGYADDDVLFGGDGNDKIFGHFGNDRIDGGNGDDRLFGWGDQDTIDGGEGNDLISGNFGDDTINGGPGNDTMYGADGDDTVNGGPGNDLVNGNSLNDTLNGGQGNDTLDGGIDTDICNGNAGIDTTTRCETITGVP